MAMTNRLHSLLSYKGKVISMEIKDYLSLISQTIRNGQPKYTERMVLEALDHGVTAGDILNRSFIPTMKDMGQRYKEDEVYIAKILSAARAMKYGLRVLKPRLEAEGEDSMHKGKVILGTVVEISMTLEKISWDLCSKAPDLR